MDATVEAQALTQARARESSQGLRGTQQVQQLGQPAATTPWGQSSLTIGGPGDMSQLASSLAALAEVQQRQQQAALLAPATPQQQQQQYLLSNSGQLYSHQANIVMDQSPTQQVSDSLGADLLHQLVNSSGDNAMLASTRMHSAQQHQQYGVESLDWPHAASAPLYTMQPTGGMRQSLASMQPMAITNIDSQQLQQALLSQQGQLLQGQVASNALAVDSSGQLSSYTSLLAAGSGMQPSRLGLHTHTTSGNGVSTSMASAGNSSHVAPSIALQQWITERQALGAQQAPHASLFAMTSTAMRQPAQQHVNGISAPPSGVRPMSYVSRPAHYTSSASGLPGTTPTWTTLAQQQGASGSLIQHDNTSVAAVAGYMPHLAQANSSQAGQPQVAYFKASASEGGLHGPQQSLTRTQAGLLSPVALRHVGTTGGVMVRHPGVHSGSCNGSKRSGASRRRKAKMYQALNAIVQAVIEEGVDREVAEAAAEEAATALKGGVPNLPGGSAACASVVQAVFQQRLQQQLLLKKLHTAVHATSSLSGVQQQHAQQAATQPAVELARLELASASAPSQSLMFSAAAMGGLNSTADADTSGSLGANTVGDSGRLQWAQLLEQLLRGDMSHGSEAAHLGRLQQACSSNSDAGDEILDSEDLQLLNHLKITPLEPAPARKPPISGGVAARNKAVSGPQMVLSAQHTQQLASLHSADVLSSGSSPLPLLPVSANDVSTAATHLMSASRDQSGELTAGRSTVPSGSSPLQESSSIGNSWSHWVVSLDPPSSSSGWSRAVTDVSANAGSTNAAGASGISSTQASGSAMRADAAKSPHPSGVAAHPISHPPDASIHHAT